MLSCDAPIAQLAEAADLKSAKCRFESDWGHWERQGRRVFETKRRAPGLDKCRRRLSRCGLGQAKRHGTALVLNAYRLARRAVQWRRACEDFRHRKGKFAIAGLLTWPGRYCRDVNRTYAWSFDYPDGELVVYWFTPERAALFREARDARLVRRANSHRAVVGTQYDGVVAPSDIKMRDGRDATDEYDKLKAIAGS